MLMALNARRSAITLPDRVSRVNAAFARKQPLRTGRAAPLPAVAATRDAVRLAVLRAQLIRKRERGLSSLSPALRGGWSTGSPGDARDPHVARSRLGLRLDKISRAASGNFSPQRRRDSLAMCLQRSRSSSVAQMGRAGQVSRTSQRRLLPGAAVTPASITPATGSATKQSRRRLRRSVSLPARSGAVCPALRR
jgi:hypothetical protein